MKELAHVKKIWWLFFQDIETICLILILFHILTFVKYNFFKGDHNSIFKVFYSSLQRKYIRVEPKE